MTGTMSLNPQNNSIVLVWSLLSTVSFPKDKIRKIILGFQSLVEYLIDRQSSWAERQHHDEVLKLQEMTKLIDTRYPSDHKFHPNNQQMCQQSSTYPPPLDKNHPPRESSVEPLSTLNQSTFSKLQPIKPWLYSFVFSHICMKSLQIFEVCSHGLFLVKHN